MMSKLAARPLPPQITVLDLNAAGCGLPEIEGLVRAPWTEQITDLSLAFNQLTDGAVQALVRGNWPRLVRLNLSVNKLGPESLRLLTQQKPPLLLESLSLNSNPTGDLGLQFLGAWPVAQTLRELDIGMTGVTAQGLLRLAESPLAATLKRLVLRGNPLGSVGNGIADALATLAKAPRLEQLDLRGTHRAVPRSGYGAVTKAPPAALCERLGAGLLW
jgi:hypothetical protein